MAVAWVGDDRAGDFWAHVEYDEPGPFGFLNGPGPATVEEAVRGLPPWLSAAPDPPPASARSDQVEGWRAEARTGWFRADRESVARRLADAVGRDDRAADAHAVARDRAFSVFFTVSAASELEANGVARSAWAALEIEAVPGDDFDVSGIMVRAV